jgi:DNA-binding CsgD family transcriptional regulator
VLVLERDPLARLLVTPAVEALGLRVGAERDPAPATAPAAVFLPLTAPVDCRSACAAARAVGCGAPPLIVGYGCAPTAPLAAHRAHRCVDFVLVLTAAAGGARFAHLPAADPVTAAGLTRREADILVLLLAGLTTPAMAGRLCVSASTARSHCRAVLRKFGAADRRELRARLLADPGGPSGVPLAGCDDGRPQGHPACLPAPPSKFV